MASYREIIDEVLALERSENARRGDETDSAPRPPATAAQITAAEAARHRAFHPSLREFLACANGWEHFAWGISLFGTDDFEGASYDTALETLGYSDDVPDELAAALLIGCNDNDATLIMLLDSGEVVDFLYEETRRYPDLASYLLARKTTLLDMRERAMAAIARTEHDWQPEVRRADDHALTAALRDAVASAPALPPAIDPASLRIPDAGPTPRAAELVARGDDGRVTASIELGVVLYLGAAPSRDEVIATFRAFRRAFPFTGGIEWWLADRMIFVFGGNRSDDPDSVPLGDALRVDDHGYYGVRLTADSGHLLNIRGIPPEDEPGGRDQRRASFVEALVPLTESPRALQQFARELCDLLPVRSGHGGYFARVHGRNDDAWNDVLAWCRRYFTVEPCYVDGWLASAHRRARGAGWLTAVGKPLLAALPPAPVVDSLARYDGKYATLLTAGAPTDDSELTLGDVAQGDFPLAIAEVARWLAPISVVDYAKHGSFTIGGRWFASSTTELPGAFNHHHATTALVRRFIDPHGFAGPTPREQCLAMIDRLVATMSETQLAKFNGATNRRELTHFRDVLRAMVNAELLANDRALQIEALELAARYPGWTPPATYNNLLLRYLQADRIGDGMALMPVALHSAREDNNPHTYHNAACVYVRAGKLDDAMRCCELAAAAKYPSMASLLADDDLAPLRGRPEWKTLSASAS